MSKFMTQAMFAIAAILVFSGCTASREISRTDPANLPVSTEELSWEETVVAFQKSMAQAKRDSDSLLVYVAHFAPDMGFAMSDSLLGIRGHGLSVLAEFDMTVYHYVRRWEAHKDPMTDADKSEQVRQHNYIRLYVKETDTWASRYFDIWWNIKRFHVAAL